jgi:hypothetical protein
MQAHRDAPSPPHSASAIGQQHRPDNSPGVTGPHPNRSTKALRTGRKDRLKPPFKLPQRERLNLLSDWRPTSGDNGRPRNPPLSEAAGAEHGPLGDPALPPVPAYAFDRPIARQRPSGFTPCATLRGARACPCPYTANLGSRPPESTTTRRSRRVAPKSHALDPPHRLPQTQPRALAMTVRKGGVVASAGRSWREAFWRWSGTTWPVSTVDWRRSWRRMWSATPA